MFSLWILEIFVLWIGHICCDNEVDPYVISLIWSKTKHRARYCPRSASSLLLQFESTHTLFFILRRVDYMVYLVFYFLMTSELKHSYMPGQLNPTDRSLSHFRSSVLYGRTIWCLLCSGSLYTFSIDLWWWALCYSTVEVTFIDPTVLTSMLTNRTNLNSSLRFLINFMLLCRAPMVFDNFKQNHLLYLILQISNFCSICGRSSFAPTNYMSYVPCRL
jgi:hypothetical protein